MSDPFIGEIRLVGYNFPPRGWALCNGQLLSIAQNTALFSLLGTTFGGDGITTFGLPNLQGRRPIGQGTQSGGGPTYTQGQAGGEEATTLALSHLPAHSHGLSASTSVGNLTSPSGAFLAASAVDAPYATTPDGAQGTPVASAGGGQPHENRPPYLALNFAIALNGLFPSRN